MDECIDSFVDETIFMSLDARGSWQVEAAEEGLDRISFFPSLLVLFHITSVPFRLKIVPGTFQLAMEVLLTKVNGILPFVNLEDITIFFRELQTNMLTMFNQF